MRSVRWSSVGTVVLAGAVALLMLFLVLRGRVWAWVPLAVAAAVAVREVRHLQRSSRPADAGFDEERRASTDRTTRRRPRRPE